MIKRSALLATVLATAALGGCASLDDYSKATTSRTVGYWQGSQHCVTENSGAQQIVGLKLEKDVMPLVANGILYVERTMPSWQEPARVWMQVTAESSFGGKAIITGKQVLKQEGPVYWSVANWEATFLDDDSLQISACGSNLVLKRQQNSATVGSL